ncbi:cupin domain-containing protein [Crenobacter cavernae]|uniref:Cupin domain-containing protein n=1 Tax=Crenobacter cavernae TaxID=2290923 RepID=A0ABY0FHC1_9NEIS|nr:cupin domain-containing protein [Crenobacter cavernae]RXZ45614.1 cupin domain-containing protein [Crenobacter cavernae]
MPQAPIGTLIRQLRKQRKATLQDVADRVGRSPAFLSLLERGLNEPAIDDLIAIADALGVSTAHFFSAPAAPAHPWRVKGDARREMSYQGGVHDTLLSPTLSGRFHMLMGEMEPGATSGDAAISENGEQGGLVLEGTLTVWVDGEEQTLAPGDSFQFDSARPHRYANLGDTVARVMWVVA